MRIKRISQFFFSRQDHSGERFGGKEAVALFDLDSPALFIHCTVKTLQGQFPRNKKRLQL